MNVSRLYLGLLGSIVAMLAFATVAHAAPTSEIEPNDNIFQATGPINTEGAKGALASTDDVDYFKVRLRPQRQVRFNYFSNNCGWYVDFQIKTIDGTSIAYEESNSSATETLTTPGLFGGPSIDAWLVIDGAGAGCTYLFTVTNTTGGPTDAIDPTPGASYPLQQTNEPNDIATQAFGPLGGNTQYTGAIDTANDVDWLWAPIRAGYTITYSFASAGGASGAEIYSNPNGSDLSSVYSRDGETQSESIAISSSSSYFIRVYGAVGSSWRLLLAPSEAFGSPSPSARISKRRLKRGKSIRILVSNSSSTSLTYTIKRGKRTVRAGRRSIVGGLATISTRKLKRGNHRLTYTIPGIGTRVARIKLT